MNGSNFLLVEKRSTKFSMAAILKWHQNHRYLSFFITVWILVPFLLFWFVMLILLTQCFGWFSKMNFKNQNNKKGAKIQTVMKELKYLWFWCHFNMAAIGYLDGGFSNFPTLNLVMITFEENQFAFFFSKKNLQVSYDRKLL